MPLNWLDVSPLSFNSLLLLERVQLSWFQGYIPEVELAIALKANPAVAWYLRHKCPSLEGWLTQLMANDDGPHDAAEVRRAELVVLSKIEDWLVYVLDPAIYDAQPFLNWDSNELTSLIDFRGKTAIDVGAGTGRLTLLAAPNADAVFAVEPVANLRFYLQDKARKAGFDNIFSAEGLITDIPFPAHFADVAMGGHVFGTRLEDEYGEMLRVTKPGGMLILCPGNTDRDNDAHHFLLSKGFQWSRFKEPEDGAKRKYWRQVPN